jgi:hypothetical protein
VYANVITSRRAPGRIRARSRGVASQTGSLPPSMSGHDVARVESERRVGECATCGAGSELGLRTSRRPGQLHLVMESQKLCNVASSVAAVTIVG